MISTHLEDAFDCYAPFIFRGSIYSNAGFILTKQAFFLPLIHACFRFWWHEHPSDRSISFESLSQEWCHSMSWNKFSFKNFSCSWHDSVGHVKTLCMSILLLSGCVESEWKHCSSLLTVEKTLSIQVWIQLKECGMGPWLVLVSLCFRENVAASCKIGSFLCSLDNLLQKNVIVLFFGNQISKWCSFEKKGYFWPTFHIF